MESIEESAAKFQGEVGRWEEEILKWLINWLSW
jgi:hypothetical protein